MGLKEFQVIYIRLQKSVSNEVLIKILNTQFLLHLVHLNNFSGIKCNNYLFLFYF